MSLRVSFYFCGEKKKKATGILFIPKKRVNVSVVTIALHSFLSTALWSTNWTKWFCGLRKDRCLSKKFRKTERLKIAVSIALWLCDKLWEFSLQCSILHWIVDRNWKSQMHRLQLFVRQPLMSSWVHLHKDIPISFWDKDRTPENRARATS